MQDDDPSDTERTHEPTGGLETGESASEDTRHDASDDAMDRAAALLQYVSGMYLEQRARRGRRHDTSAPDDRSTVVSSSSVRTSE